MDLSSIHTVTKQYNWRGEHIGYQINGTTIPRAEDNRDYLALSAQIANGLCGEIEPDFTKATKVNSSEGKLTGYDTNLGFVPDDPTNRLLVLLNRTVERGALSISEPEEPHAQKLDALIFCAILDRGWHHLTGRLTRKVEYRPHEKANPVEVEIRISNLPESPEDVLPHVFGAMGIEQAFSQSFQFKALQAGMIEIEVPVKSLLKLFRNERARVPTAIEPFFADWLAQHYVRSARDESKGPDVAWLISMAPYFLTCAVANMANVALQAFAVEYGGKMPGHVAEDMLLRSSLSFARHADGKKSLHRFQHQPEQSFGLEGLWPAGVTMLRLADNALRKQLDLNFVRSRVRQLFDAGFAMEALVVANATFEVALEWALAGTVTANEKARRLILAKGHSYRLELLDRIVASNVEAGLSTEAFHEFLSALVQSNLMRNSYLHQLVVPTQDYWNFAQLDRTVERVLRFIVDPHQSFLTLSTLLELARIAQPGTVALLITELQKLKEWNDVDAA